MTFYVDKPSKFQFGEHNKKLLNYAEEKRKSGLYNDVIIVVGKKSIPANKLVLSCYSKFFETMFETNMKEKYEKEVEIKSVDGDTMKLLVDFIYTGEILVHPDNVMNILAASDYLQLDSVKEFCFKYLETNLSPHNCLNIISAHNYFNPKATLTQAAYQLLRENIQDISQTVHFKTLSKSNLISLIIELGKSETIEKVKYQAIVNWVSFDTDTRGNFFPALFSLIAVQKLPVAFLNEVVRREPLVQQHNKCLNAVMACTFELLQEPTLQDGKPKILCVGGSINETVFELFGKGIGKTTKTYPKLPLVVSGHGLAKVNNFVYCIGGLTTGGPQTKRVYQINLKDPVLKWTEVASLSKARSYFGCSVVNGRIVVSGGSGSGGSSESYNEGSNEWREISTLNHERYGHSVVGFGGRAYAIGGWGKKSTECLSHLNGKWEKSRSMKTSRYHFASVSCNGFIYAIGGLSSEKSEISGISIDTEKSVEMYNPIENSWVDVKPMNIERSGHSACVVQDKIFVVGGKNAENKFVHEIECYDPTREDWSIVGEVEAELYGHAITVL